MSWDFSTEPDFQQQLDWMAEFVRREIWPLESIWTELGIDGLARALVPLQEEVKGRGLWAAHLPPALGGMGFGQVRLGLMHEILGQSPLALPAWYTSGFRHAEAVQLDVDSSVGSFGSPNPYEAKVVRDLLRQLGSGPQAGGSGLLVITGQAQPSRRLLRDLRAGERGTQFVGLHHFGFIVQDIDQTRKSVEQAGGKHWMGEPADGSGFYEVKYCDPNGVVFDITENGWTGAAKD